jgi:hypothetical protein
MRFDKINLIGNFIIRGATPSTGQVLGVSGSKIDWISPISNGGETGPQGVGGLGAFNPVPNGFVVFGSGDSINYSPVLKIDIGLRNMSVSSTNTNFFTGSNISGAISSNTTYFIGNGSANSIISSYQSRINYCSNSFIIGSRFSCINNSENSVILGSSYRMRYSPNSIIMSSQNNGAYLQFSPNSVILSSRYSTPNISCSYNSSIISSNNTCISANNTYRPDNSIIVSSYKSCIESGSCNSAVLASQGYILGLDDGPIFKNNAIIGGGGGILHSNNTVLIGTDSKFDYILSMCNKTMGRHVSIDKKISFKPLKNTPSNLTNGMIWYSEGIGLAFYNSGLFSMISMTLVE